MDAALVPGDGVELRSLVARPELNGRRARLLRLTNERWIVELEASKSGAADVAPAPGAADERLKIKPANMNKVQSSKKWSLELNKQAVAAQKAGDFKTAEKTWTKILDVISTSGRGDQVKVLHGNRAAARLELADAKGALEDAERCVSLDATWEKGWLRKIDALEELGQIVRAYDVALDASKCLPKGARSQVDARVTRLAARPETQGFLADSCRVKGSTFCCFCNALQGVEKSFLACSTCKQVFYCGKACQSKDFQRHMRSCDSLRVVHVFDDLQSSGRLWYGSVDENGRAAEYRILIDAERRFEFPRLVCNLSSSANQVQNLVDWATLVTSHEQIWSKDPVSKVISADKFRSIVSGKDLSPEDFTVHQIATMVASYPLTLFHALRKFDLLGSKAVLVVHVIGAEANYEGAYAQSILSVLHPLMGGTTLLVMYIGPLNCQSSSPDLDPQTFRELLARPDSGTATAFFFKGTYGEFLMSKLYSPPDLVMAFHGGFHDGTYPWWPTLQFLLHENVPLAVTCFSDKDLASTHDMLANNELFIPLDLLEETNYPFSSRFLRPVVEGRSELKTDNMHLLCMRGIRKAFPKSGVVFDAAHTETMAVTILANLGKGMSEAESYILKQRAYSYVVFSMALEMVRPCRRQGDAGLISKQHPQMWRQLLATIE